MSYDIRMQIWAVQLEGQIRQILTQNIEEQKKEAKEKNLIHFY